MIKFIFYFFFLISFFFLLLIVLSGSSAEKCLRDYKRPLDMVLFREPNIQYSDDQVNKWVQKPWRKDGKKIPCRFEKYYEDDVKNHEKKWIIYSHGNGENLLHCIPFARDISKHVKMDVLCWDYSGYGLNDYDSFERTPEGIHLTLNTIIDEMVLNGYETRNLYLWGYSLGTGPSTAVASEIPDLAGLVLFSAYTSILDVVSHLSHPSLSQMFEERWNNLENIQNVKCPILLFHGQFDNLIPVEHSKKLHEITKDRSKIVIFLKTGHEYRKFAWDQVIQTFLDWIINV